MKLWGGRFSKGPESDVERFLASLPFDKRLYREDVRGSIAHARMLGRTGIIPAAEAEQICDELTRISAELEDGTFEFPPEAEDIHMAIESVLIARTGDVGRKLHTARSRNDQVATDTRLYMKRVLEEVDRLLHGVDEQLVDLAERHAETVLPGYTHMQPAQPVLLAHHLLAYFEMFERDRDRLRDCKRRTDVLPLGSGALAGVAYPEIDREGVARELGFAGISANSLDAVSDRDYVVEFLSAASIVMMHVSRLAGELVLWSTTEFGYVEMDDAFSTGSSIMPQKKNPDVAELLRGKGGRVYGSLVSLLTTMKGLPLAYNTDMQEDKEALFDAVDTVTSCLAVLRRMLETLTFRPERMEQATREGFLNATDLADYLVGRGVPFRTAHEQVGRLVRYAIESSRTLEQLDPEEIRRFCPDAQEDVYDAIRIEASVNARDVFGGTAARRVANAVQEAQRRLADASPPASADGARNSIRG